MGMQVRLKNEIVGINSTNAQQKSAHPSLLKSSVKFCSKCVGGLLWFGFFWGLSFIFQAESTSVIS